MGSRPSDSLCATRREFLLAGAGVTGTILLSTIFPGTALGERRVKFTTYPRKLVATLSRLKTDRPVSFSYPSDDFYSSSMIVKLGTRAGGGVGPGEDIVAFNTLCSHMGGPLQNEYKSDLKVLGPCSFHLTSFDLTRHGMVVAGHATESLPQVVLEQRGDEIYATGLIGLIYGYSDNLGDNA